MRNSSRNDNSVGMGEKEMRPIILYPKELKTETIKGLQELWDMPIKSWQKKKGDMKCLE